MNMPQSDNMLKKQLFTRTFIIILFVLLVYVFFFCPQKEEYYQDVNELIMTYEKSDNKVIQPLIPLIPERAEDIMVSYRQNRVKSILIVFKIQNIHWKSYILAVKKKLKGFSMPTLPQNQRGETVYFRGTPDTLFEQIDISIHDDYISIQSF